MNENGLATIAAMKITNLLMKERSNRDAVGLTSKAIFEKRMEYWHETKRVQFLEIATILSKWPFSIEMQTTNPHHVLSYPSLSCSMEQHISLDTYSITSDGDNKNITCQEGTYDVQSFCI